MYLRVDECKLNDVHVLDRDGVAHGSVDSFKRCVFTHAQHREQTRYLGHLVGAEEVECKCGSKICAWVAYMSLTVGTKFSQLVP
jgi:hypothetical protein